MVFMHGAYVDWESNLEQSELTYRWIRCACPGRPLNVIFFTWPSDQTRLLLAACELRQLGAAAEANAFYVASLLACIPDCHPICLVGHSFGARMALATTHLIAGGAIQGRRLACAVGCKRIRVVLAAAAVDHNWLNDCQRFELAACYAEGILNLVNRQDCILKFYPLLRLFSRRALGSVGQTPIDRNRLSCACKVQNCNVTGLVGHGHFWPNYYRSPQIARILAPWVYFPEAAVTYPAMPSAAAAHAAPEEAALQASHALEPTPLDAEVELHTAVPVSQVRPGWTRGSTSMRSEPEYRPIRAWLSSL